MQNSVGVFDIGSNTVLLTGGRLDNQRKLHIILECHDVARLSEGLIDGGPLQPAAKTRTLEILRSFQAEARKAGIHTLYAAGTAAFRRAGDGADFASAIEKNLNIPVRILSGKEEAHYSFYSVVKDFGTQETPLGMIDIGGGSTELVFGNETDRFSLPIGTVRLVEGFVSGHPIVDSEWNALQKEIRRTIQSELPKNLPRPVEWVAVAATPTALANLLQGLSRFDPQRVHGYLIHYKDLDKTLETLRNLSVADREKLQGMPPKRAELLPLGGIILKTVMNFLGLEEIWVSNHGLRYGLLWEYLESSSQG